MTRTYVNENKEQPRGFAGGILKEYHDRKTKTVKKIVLCVMEQSFKYASLATLNNVSVNY